MLTAAGHIDPRVEAFLANYGGRTHPRIQTQVGGFIGVIGFVGGGGIGLILFRSTNLTQYQKAAVMVIAIAIVVTLLDYTSSRIRTRIT